MNPAKTVPFDVNHLIQQAAYAAQRAAAWTQVQASDVVQQFFHWRMADDIMSMVVSFLVFVALYLVAFKNPWTKEAMRRRKEQDFEQYCSYGFNWDRSDCSTIFIISSLIFSINTLVNLLVIVSNAFDLIKLMVAPKLYLIEYAVSLVQNHH